MNVLVSVATGGFSNNLYRCAPSIKKWWPGSVMVWTDELPPGSPTHAEQPYAFKAFAAKWAFDNGYKTVTWIDSAIHVASSPDRYIQHLNEEGYFFQNNGFNCAQTCSDKALDYYGISRDAAENIVEVVGGCWGLHVRNSNFVDELCRNAKIGLFSGSREKDPSDSTDPRFLFCRHDQSLMSLMVYNRGWTPKTSWDETSSDAFFNYGPTANPNKCFVLDNSYGQTNKSF